MLAISQINEKDSMQLAGGSKTDYSKKAGSEQQAVGSKRMREISLEVSRSDGSAVRVHPTIIEAPCSKLQSAFGGFEIKGRDSILL